MHRKSFIILSWTMLVMISAVVCHSGEERHAAKASNKFWKSGNRPLPAVLKHHPGNIFIEGEDVNIPVPPEAKGKCLIFDVDGKLIASLQDYGKLIKLGKLGIGYYKIKWDNGQQVSSAVIAPLKAPIPDNSPLCAHAWLGGCYILGIIDSIDDATNILALVGINSIRSSTAWKWHFCPDGSLNWHGTRKAKAFDMTIAASKKYGLRVLMLIEPGVPKKYALPRGSAFPADLRDYYRFSKIMVARAGQGVDWEAWNEPSSIGGMLLGSEFTAGVKVFALAAHSAYPDVYVGMGGANAGNRDLTDAMNKNGYLDAVDSYNYHSHCRFPASLKTSKAVMPYAGTRRVWATEYSYGSYRAAPDSHQLTEKSELTQARDIPVMLARGTHNGLERIYYFMPFDFGETANRKWGVLKRKTLQPRPGFLALAAAGRLFAGASPAGKLTELPDDVEGWLFKGKPDGHERLVAVIWKNHPGNVDWKPYTEVQAWDLWGRSIPIKSGDVLKIGQNPLYCVFSRNDLQKWKHSPVRQNDFKRPARDSLCPVVADYRLPRSLKNCEGDNFIFTGSEPIIDVDIYNFSDKQMTGIWHASSTSSFSAKVIKQPGKLEPGGRSKLRVKIVPKATFNTKAGFKRECLRLVGDYRKFGTSVMQIRFVLCASNLASSHITPVSGAMMPKKWHSVAAAGTDVKTSLNGSWMEFLISNGPAPNKTIGTVWAAPVYWLTPAELPPINTWGLSLKFRRFKVRSKTAFSINIIKKNGSAWHCSLPIVDKKIDSSGGMRFTLPLSWFFRIKHRKPDSTGVLRPEDIAGIEVVATSKPFTKVKIGVSDFSWVSNEKKKNN